MLSNDNGIDSPKVNVFEFLSEDAIRRKRDQELLENTLN
jgi:hypothetical protein